MSQEASAPAPAPAAEVWFYHLLHRRIESVLPDLLEKSRARGWTAAVQGMDAQRLAALDDLLWTYSDEGFLPHGREGEPHAARQPVLLTAAPVDTNSAAVRFFIDGADVAAALAPERGARYQRCILLFDGNDEAALAAARAQWRALKAAGHPVTYWQEDASGRFAKQA